MHHMDDMRCRHCNALIALIPRASVVGRFTLKCGICGVLLVVWPVERQPITIKANEYQASQ
jgi:phage FluMu protein Com